MANSKTSQTLLIGIDDTDNLESRGTGFHARHIGEAVEAHNWGSCRVISRHQLLKSPLVPFTSHNSAACIRVEIPASNLATIENYCVDYLRTNSADGSDAGLCLVWQAQAALAIQQFGFVCKRQLVSQQAAWELAKQREIKLFGLTGTQDGVIGALAAAGLNASGSDGRMLWLAGMRELAGQTVSLESLLAQSGIELVQSLQGQVLTDPTNMIAMGPWPRGIWLGGKATLLVEPNTENADGWQVAAKDYLRQF
jgi:hypothetical protein